MAPKVSNFLYFFLLFLLLPLKSRANFFKSKDEESSPFAFMKHFHGMRNGEKAIGLHELKKYLEHFGYLSYHNFESPTHSKDDYFDHLLESAIKTYQLNYRLNVTGMLDARTVSTMMMPRCGVPDIINDTNWMQLAFKEGSYYAFMDGNPKWHKFHLTYALGRMRTNVAMTISHALEKWASVSRFKFTRSRNFKGADLKISFERGDHGDGESFDGRGGVLAHAFAPTDGRLHFDADERWAVGAAPSAFDIGSIGLHEIGHLLGLGHSTVRNAIMFPTISAGEKKGLRSDDIQGIRALYH